VCWKNRAFNKEKKMLMDRIYTPADDSVLYHYCSASTFQAIATNRTMRFSDINMLNDESEVRWGYSVFEEAATRIIRRAGVSDACPVITEDFIEEIDKIISPAQLVAHPFIACFSLEPDILSQWRAYADDGRGFAVGFNGALLAQNLPVTLLKVLYEREQQVKEMMLAIISIYVEQHGQDGENRGRFIEDCILLATYMTAFKHPAFIEEQEVRAVHAVGTAKQGNLAKFVDGGGILGGDVEAAGIPVSFQVRDGHLNAYMDLSLTPLERPTPISRLVLGPKNHGLPGNLYLFLGGLGYESIDLRKSSAPYR